MKNKRHLFKMTLVFSLLCALFISGCGRERTGNTAGKASQKEEAVTTGAVEVETNVSDEPDGNPEAIRAMYLTDPSGNVYFVDTQIGTFFTAPIPEELYNSSGEKISADTLSAGFILDIYGNGIMLESYPGQYPGVTKMTVVKEGTTEDAKEYQYLIDEIYTEPDLSDPPYMNAEYATDQFISAVMLTRGSYEWSYLDEAGKSQSVIACGTHILEWENLIDMTVDADTKVTLVSSYAPQSVTITRWPVSLWNPENHSSEGEGYASDPQGQAVEITKEEDAFAVIVDPGYVYLVNASWEEGNMEYGFYTK